MALVVMVKPRILDSEVAAGAVDVREQTPLAMEVGFQTVALVGPMVGVVGLPVQIALIFPPLAEVGVEEPFVLYGPETLVSFLQLL